VPKHPTREGKVYCAVVLDAFSRRVVGRSISHNPTAGLTTNALGMAIEQRDASRGTVIHSETRGTARNSTKPGVLRRLRGTREGSSVGKCPRANRF
jgi:transposase InsO family protein